jgi:hypothetical protein
MTYDVLYTEEVRYPGQKTRKQQREGEQEKSGEQTRGLERSEGGSAGLVGYPTRLLAEWVGSMRCCTLEEGTLTESELFLALKRI